MLISIINLEQLESYMNNENILLLVIKLLFKMEILQNIRKFKTRIYTKI